ncbi:MAG: glycogen debranching enzyme N-terminal domain-containing protein [Porphyromonas sp.]|nr:glycogen debranching enzyme N-terminal domain-containing protein [Porphyromonas sp.]
MKYLRFDRTNLTNLGDSLEKEVLRSNRRGAYCCTTILGCNTRKYHGLLIVPHTSGSDSLLLLSSLDETVIQHGAEFNLAVHQYADGAFSPNGHKYVREFSVENSVSTVYRVGGVILQKDIVFSVDRNQLIVRYKLLDAHSRTTLRLRPFLAFRKTKELTHENDRINWAHDKEDNGISMCLYEGYPRLYMQLSKEAEWYEGATWYKNFNYVKEETRGNEHTEDLPVPGHFEFEIGRGEEVYISISDEAVESSQIAGEFEKALKEVTPSNSFINCLRRSADQFYVQREEGNYLLAGYPWFGVQHRDQMVALTACSFGIGVPERFNAVMETTIKALRAYYDADSPHTDTIIEGIDQPDALLWTINCIQDYSRWVGMKRTREEYGEVVKWAIECIEQNRHPDMRLRDNQLLYAVAPSPSKPITWMDRVIDGYPVVDRQGYIVEFNALWYNALCFYRNLFQLEDERLNDKIERVSESFIRVFVNKYDYLFDYVADGREQDWNVRANQIFAAGLTYSPLSRKLQRSVLDIVTKELLTPKGIRTLSPMSPYYRGYASGNLKERFYAYMQGGVWSWLIYYYLTAYLKLFRQGGISYVDRLLIPFEEELSLHGIGTIAEVYDGTPPYKARSGISFLMSVSALLRIGNRLEEFMEYDTDIFDLRLSMTTHHPTSPESGKETTEDTADEKTTLRK